MNAHSISEYLEMLENARNWGKSVVGDRRVAGYAPENSPNLQHKFCLRDFGVATLAHSFMPQKSVSP